MKSKATSVADYLGGLPEDRRVAISKVRKTILKHLPRGYKECIQYGMLAYVVPLETFPAGYLNRKNEPLPYAGLASQKNYMSLYLMSIYGPAETQFREEYKATGNRLDMGKCCVRFRSLDDLPLDVISREISRFSVEQWIAYMTQEWKKRRK